MQLFLFATSEKSPRRFSKFEIAAAGASHWEAAKKCSGTYFGKYGSSPYYKSVSPRSRVPKCP